MYCSVKHIPIKLMIVTKLSLRPYSLCSFSVKVHTEAYYSMSTSELSVNFRRQFLLCTKFSFSELKYLLYIKIPTNLWLEIWYKNNILTISKQNINADAKLLVLSLYANYSMVSILVCYQSFFFNKSIRNIKTCHISISFGMNPFNSKNY